MRTGLRGMARVLGLAAWVGAARAGAQTVSTPAKEPAAGAPAAEVPAPARTTDAGGGATQPRRSAREWMEEGRRRYGAGDYEGALACFRAAAEAAGKSRGRLDPARARLNAGSALFKLGQPEAAEQAFEEALHTADPETQARAWYNLARAAIERAERAVQAGQPAAARDPMNQALEALRNSMRLDPADLEAKINFEWARRRLEEIEELAKQQAASATGQEPGTEPQPGAPSPESGQEPQTGEQEKPATAPTGGEESPQEQEGEPAEQQSPPKGGEPHSGVMLGEGAEKGSPPEEREISREDALRWLDALRAEEEALRRQVRRRLGELPPVEKDW